MLIAERQQKILQILERQGGATVKELAKALFASAPTIRRDLTVLAENGLLKKVYGGAVPLTASNREIPLTLRAQSQNSAKDRMAQQAVSHVRDGMVILMDGSSSVNHIVRYLTDFKDLLVVTSGARTAIDLAEQNIPTLCTGGQMLNHSLSFVGYQAEEFVRRIHADLLFFSCCGLNDEGLLTDPAMEEAHIRQVMLRQARKKILLCDKSKLHQTFFYTLCHRDELDAVISE